MVYFKSFKQSHIIKDIKHISSGAIMGLFSKNKNDQNIFDLKEANIVPSTTPTKCSICGGFADGARRITKDGYYVCAKCYVRCDKPPLFSEKTLNEIVEWGLNKDVREEEKRIQEQERQELIQQRQKEEVEQKEADKLEQMKYSKIFYANRTVSIIKIDDKNHLFMHVYESPYIFKFSDIISYDVKVNGATHIKGGGVGTLIGGSLFGVTGAIVGNAFSPKQAKESIENITIVISLNNKDYPILSINCGISTDKANKIAAVIEQMMEIANRENTMLQKPTNSSDNTLDDVAKIREFKKLFDEGILTEEEFIAKKKQILGI